MKLLISILSILLFAQASQACFGQLASSMSQGVSQQVQLENQYADRLMDMASKRNEIERDCREELLEHLVEYRTKKIELERKQQQQRFEIEDAEIEYELAVNQLKQQCEQEANQQFQELTGQIYSVPTGNPAQAAASATMINSQWRNAYVGCWSGYENIQGGQSNGVQLTVQSHARKMRNEINKIREETNFAMQQLRELHQQTTLLQANTERNCREARELQDYNEAVIATQQSRAMAANSQMQSLNTMGAVMSCISTGMGGMNPGGGINNNQQGNAL